MSVLSRSQKIFCSQRLFLKKMFFFPPEDEISRLRARDVFCSARFKNDVIIVRSKNVVAVGFYIFFPGFENIRGVNIILRGLR